jgi:hypothetical protein
MKSPENARLSTHGGATSRGDGGGGRKAAYSDSACIWYPCNYKTIWEQTQDPLIGGYIGGFNRYGITLTRTRRPTRTS